MKLISIRVRQFAIDNYISDNLPIFSCFRFPMHLVWVIIFLQRYSQECPAYIESIFIAVAYWELEGNTWVEFQNKLYRINTQTRDHAGAADKCIHSKRWSFHWFDHNILTMNSFQLRLLSKSTRTSHKVAFLPVAIWRLGIIISWMLLYLDYLHRSTHPYHGHLAVVDSPEVQQFLACYIRYREKEGKLQTKDVYLGKLFC